jgi:NIPSNAP protein
MTTRRELLKSAGILAGFAALGVHPSSTETALLQNCSVAELRQYTLHAGARETLVSLFESEFIQPQETIGMAVFGPFRDLDDPNRFVWMRGFPDMVERKRMLAAFYGSPVWMAHREAANATMLDSDNVLLLRPEPSPSAARILGDSALQRHSLLVVNIHYVTSSAIEEFARFFEQSMKPRLAETGAHVMASFGTENAPNTFPRLPVREGETVFVWLAAFSDMDHYRQHVATLRAGPDWREHAPESVIHQLARKPEVLLLAPTPHAQLSI